MVQDSIRRIYGLLSHRLRLTAFKSNPRHPRLVACAIATLLLGAISATVLVTDVGASFGSTIPVLSGVEPLKHVDESRSSPATIGLALAPTSIDLSSSSLTLNWWATACGPTSDEGETNRSTSSSATELAMRGMQNTTCGRSYEAFSVSLDFNPVYVWNASDTILNTDGGQSPIRFTPQETFDTTHNFTWISARQSLAQRRQHSVSAWYPFDRYTVSTTVEAFGGSDASALPVHFLHMYSGLTGYELRIDSAGRVKTARSEEALYVTFSIRRCKGVKLFAVTLFLTNYILAAAMVWVAVCAYHGPPLPETALFLPLANILLLPQLRAAMPGVPDFGAWIVSNEPSDPCRPLWAGADAAVRGAGIFMDLFGYYVNIVAVRGLRNGVRSEVSVSNVSLTQSAWQICFAALFMFFKIIGSRIDGRAPRDEEYRHRRSSLPLYRCNKEAFPAIVKVVPFVGSVTVGPSKHDATEANCTIEHVEDVATRATPESPCLLAYE